MPSADSATADQDTDVLAAERQHLRRSREFLELMRADVLSLRAMGGDPVSEEYLKADLHRRAPVSRPFYRASQTDPMGLDQRRRFGFAGGELTAFEDELFGGAGEAG